MNISLYVLCYTKGKNGNLFVTVFINTNRDCVCVCLDLMKNNFLLYSLYFFIFNQIISFFILLIIISFTSYNSTEVATRNTALNQKRISLSILHLDCNKTRRKVTRIYNDRRPSSIYSSIASHLGTLHFDIHTHLFAESVSHVTLWMKCVKARTGFT